MKCTFEEIFSADIELHASLILALKQWKKKTKLINGRLDGGIPAGVGTLGVSAAQFRQALN